jgi:hypothetical protein
MKRVLCAVAAVVALLPLGRAASADEVNLLFDSIGPTRSGAMANALEP